jgi:hypothetical protein
LNVITSDTMTRKAIMQKTDARVPNTVISEPFGAAKSLWLIATSMIERRVGSVQDRVDEESRSVQITAQ